MQQQRFRREYHCIWFGLILKQGRRNSRTRQNAALSVTRLADPDIELLRVDVQFLHQLARLERLPAGRRLLDRANSHDPRLRPNDFWSAFLLLTLIQVLARPDR